MSPEWEEAVHSIRAAPHVIDIRNYGLIGAVELEPRAGKPGARAFDVFLKCFERGVMVRVTGDTIALSPPLIIESAQIAQIVETLARALSATRRLGLARLEDRIPLLAGLDDLPRALEARGHDEGVAGLQLVPLAAGRFDAHAALDQHAELVLGVSDAPFAAVLDHKPQKNCCVESAYWFDTRVRGMPARIFSGEGFADSPVW